MGALVSTIMLTALFAMPMCIAEEEWIKFFGKYRAPTCDQLNQWGVNNVTSGVKIGICALTPTRAPYDASVAAARPPVFVFRHMPVLSCSACR